MTEILAGAAIALAWISIFGFAWLVNQFQSGKEASLRATVEWSGRITKLQGRCDRNSETANKHEKQLVALGKEIIALQQLLNAETGVYQMTTDKDTGKQTWTRAALEDSFLQAAAQKGPEAILAEAERMISRP